MSHSKGKSKRLFSLTSLLLLGIVLVTIIGGLVTMLLLPRFFPFNAVHEAKTLQSICSQSKEHDLCYADMLYSFAKKHPIQQTLLTLNALQGIDSTTAYCHLYAHKISIAEVSKDPNKWLQTLDKVNLNSCSRGFFHGVIEGYSQFHSDFELTPKTIASVCTQVATRKSKNMTQQNDLQSCLHATGHMLLVQERTDVHKSVDICSQLEKTMQTECLSGVFMENMNRENLFIHGLAKRTQWTSDEIFSQQRLCESYSGLPSTVCWRDLGQMFGLLGNGSSEKMHMYCQQAPTQEAKVQCEINGAGFQAFMSADNKFEKSALTTACDYMKGESNTYKKCLGFVVSYVTNSSPSFIPQVREYCQLQEDELRDYCNSYLLSVTPVSFGLDQERPINL